MARSHPALDALFVCGLALAGALSCALSAGCAGAGPEPTPAAPTASVTVLPRPLSGAPVVLASAVSGPVEGVQWGWLMPEARAVALLPADVDGRRPIVAPLIFPAPSGAIIGRDAHGELALASGGALHTLGSFETAVFDGQGKSALAWGADSWALFSSDGERKPVASVGGMLPELLPSGLVLERFGGRTVILDPSGSARLNWPGFCQHVFPAAKRLVCADEARDTVTVLNLDTGAVLARIERAPDVNGALFAMRPDGSQLAWATYTAYVADLTGDGAITPRSIGRLMPPLNKGGDPGYNRWIARRIAYTQDGKHVCTAGEAATIVHDSTGRAGAAPAGFEDLCFMASRASLPAGPGNPAGVEQWSAWLARLPLHDGFNKISWGVPPQDQAASWDVSSDRTTGIFLEEKRSGDQWIVQAVAVDLVAGAEKKVIPIVDTVIPSGQWPTEPTVELSENGKIARVCSPSIFAARCKTFDTSNGAPTMAEWITPVTAFPPNAQSWAGAVPEAHVSDVAALLATKDKSLAKVTAWHDEGTYISIDLDLGKEQNLRLNVPGRLDSEATEVVAVAGGKMVAITEKGAVTLWSAEPLAIRAVLIPVGGGIAVLYPDGTFETTGVADERMRCQMGETIAPIAACGGARAAAGTLQKMIAEASAPKEAEAGAQ